MFCWKIHWLDTGEIQIKQGYVYPHTALAGAKAFAKRALAYGERGDTEPLRVEIVEGDAEKVSRGRGKVVKYYEDVTKDFVAGRTTRRR